MNLLIQNAVVVNADASLKADVRCADGQIVEVDQGLIPIADERILDAEGCLLFPGGIDPHVHMQLPTALGRSSDDFYSGSVAALMGGTTTLIDFVTPEKGQSLSEAISLRKAEAESSVLDHTFHVSPVEWRKSMPGEISMCVEKEGLPSFKAYMAYKKTIGLEEADLLRVMQSIATVEGVLAVHCEMGDEIEKRRDEYAETGKLSPKYHALSRPAHLEAKAVERLIDLVEKSRCTVYIVHVSSALSLEKIEDARKKGLPVYAETCPQYLLLTDQKYEQQALEAIKFVMSPPLRKQRDNTALWKAISSGLVQSIGTDHCPFMLEQKMYGLEDFRKIPNGAGGVEHRLALLYTYGVLENKITLEQFVALSSTNAARIFGLYPRKGRIAKGSDADLLIWDPSLKRTISHQDHYQNCDFNIYEGMPVQGGPKFVIARGRILVDEGVLTLDDQKGQFLARPNA
jgi:dihydropyrimidinase